MTYKVGDHFIPRVVEGVINVADTTIKELFDIPEGARILRIEVDAETGFDGTTPTFDLGYIGGDEDALVDGSTLPATAIRASATNPPTATIGEWNGATGGAVGVKFVGGGTNTTGSATIKVLYYV
jgi:hypothetical protein